MSVDDNFVRKMFEAWWENWSETAINVYFAERSGVEQIQLDEDTANELIKLVEEGKFALDEMALAALVDDHIITIDFDTATPALKFRVDASTSKMKEDAAQGDILTNLLGSLESSQLLASVVPPEKVLATWNRIVSNSGVEDPEELSVDLEEFRAQQEAAQQAAMQQQAMQAAAPVEGQLQAPAEAPAPQPSEADVLLEQLAAAGVPESVLAEAQQALAAGEDPNDVIEAITALVEGDTANVA